ncbi:MAG: sulfatase-like hydrolase/transferase, partial [Balneolaceae bacterium]|nr:sulfatase-like hydrolase/transferase [Balneolaceae bacterium]
DMGYGDLKSYNQNQRFPLQSVDGSAKGIRFMAMPVHPERCAIRPVYGLLAGRYPFSTVLTSVWPNEPVIEKGRMTIASLLQSQGYKTSMVGKWHLIRSMSTQDRADYTGNNGNNASCSLFGNMKKITCFCEMNHLTEIQFRFLVFAHRLISRLTFIYVMTVW